MAHEIGLNLRRGCSLSADEGSNTMVADLIKSLRTVVGTQFPVLLNDMPVQSFHTTGESS